MEDVRHVAAVLVSLTLAKRVFLGRSARAPTAHHRFRTESREFRLTFLTPIIATDLKNIIFSYQLKNSFVECKRQPTVSSDLNSKLNVLRPVN